MFKIYAETLCLFVIQHHKMSHMSSSVNFELHAPLNITLLSEHFGTCFSFMKIDQILRKLWPFKGAKAEWRDLEKTAFKVYKLILTWYRQNHLDNRHFFLRGMKFGTHNNMIHFYLCAKIQNPKIKRILWPIKKYITNWRKIHVILPIYILWSKCVLAYKCKQMNVRITIPGTSM